MKRIELNTGVAERGYWNGQAFEFTMHSKVGSLGFGIKDDDFADQLKLAIAWLEQHDGLPDNLVFRYLGSGQEFFLFDKEDVDAIIADNDAEEFLIYLETKTVNIFVCDSGLRNRDIPKHQYPKLRVTIPFPQKKL